MAINIQIDLRLTRRQTSVARWLLVAAVGMAGFGAAVAFAYPYTPQSGAVVSSSGLKNDFDSFDTRLTALEAPAFYVSASIAGGDMNLGGANTIATWTPPTSAALTLTNASASAVQAELACAGSVAPSGTTCSNAGEPGIAFAITRAGDYEVCVIGTHQLSVGANGDTTLATTWTLGETASTGQVITGKQSGGVTTALGQNLGGAPIHSTVPFQICDVFTWTTVGQKTIRLGYTQAYSGNVAGTVSTYLLASSSVAVLFRVRAL